MRVRLAPLALSLLVATSASATPLIGAWSSDRDLTLLEKGRFATLTLERRELFATPDLFGRLVAIRDDREIEFRLAEGSPRLSYRIVATGSDFGDVETGAAPSDEAARSRLLLHGGLLHMPVEDPGFHEVFRHIGAAAALAP